MKPESTRVPEDYLGSLSACLVDNDPEQHRRSSKIRRRAILFSVVLQTLTLSALIIFPLLGRGERLPAWIVVPPPPYKLGSHRPPTGQAHNTHRATQNRFNFSHYSTTPIRPVTSTPSETNSSQVSPPGTPEDPVGDRNGNRFGVELPSHSVAPAVPPPTPVKPPRIVSQFDPSRIIHRVEPIYPSLAIQTRRETRVELHAIISTDGSIQSLQVISGDPLFYQSALSAVTQWRYTPTLLNNQPVEVDTHITVIYSLNH